LTVHDDGAGFDPALSGAEGAGAGLVNMRDRLDAVGGSVSLRSSPGAGTTVTAEVPVDAPAPPGGSAVPAPRRAG
jgi:signal transduction histidine kinase